MVVADTRQMGMRMVVMMMITTAMGSEPMRVGMVRVLASSSWPDGYLGPRTLALGYPLAPLASFAF